MQIMPEINVDKLFMLPAAFVERERERESVREIEKEREEKSSSMHSGIYHTYI